MTLMRGLARWFVFALGLIAMVAAVLVPIALVTVYGRAAAHGPGLLFGLEADGLYFLRVTLVATLCKIAAPSVTRQLWPTRRLLAVIIMLLWPPMAAASTGVVLILAPSFMPPTVVAPPVGPLLAVCWIPVEGCAGLSPFALVP